MCRSVSLHCSFHGHRRMCRWARAACRYLGPRKGRCAAGFIYPILGDLLATCLPYFMCSMPHSGKDVDVLHRRTWFVSRARMCLVAQKSSPAVRRAEGGCRSMGVFGIYEPQRHPDEVCRASGTMWIRSSAESAVAVLSHTWLMASSLAWGRK